MRTKILIWFIAFILLVGSVHSIGVAPARTKLFFEPNLNEDHSLTILNNNDEERKFEFSVAGELQPYITIQDSIFVKPKSQEEVKFNLALPSTLRPGRHKADIMVTEITPTSAPGETNVGAHASVKSEVLVIEPYPGKYIEAKLNTDPVPERATINFRIEVENLGTEDLENIKARIEIYDGETLTDELKTNTISLKSKDSGKLTALLSQGLLSGKYKAVAIIEYDGEEIVDEIEFTVDKPLNIFGLSKTTFNVGEVVKLQLEVENRWKDSGLVYSDIEIWDSMGNPILKLKTSETTVNPMSKTMLEGFWDTTGLEPDDYQLKYTTHIFGIKMDNVFAVELLEKKASNYTNIVILAVIIIVLILAIALFNLYKLRRKNTKK